MTRLGAMKNVLATSFLQTPRLNARRQQVRSFDVQRDDIGVFVSHDHHHIDIALASQGSRNADIGLIQTDKIALRTGE